MGMFDEYIANIECPYCGENIPKFQGKDGPRVLEKYQLGDQMYDHDNNPMDDGVMEIHEICGRERGPGTTWHWVQGLAIVHEGRWITTVIVSVSTMGTATSEDLWSIRKKE